MKKTAVIACSSLLASAIAAQTVPTANVDNASNGSVRVAVLPPLRDAHEPLRYQLSEPAYVAAFVVYPGAGVRLLYPLINTSETLQRAGYHTEQLYSASFDNDIYRAVLGPKGDGPAYLYVIASRHPLDVARYVHRPMQLASAVGTNQARSFYADVAFDGIVNNAVTLGDDASWDADVYTLWPQNESERRLDGRSSAGYTMALCRDGTSQAVPINYPFAGCPSDVQVRLQPTISKPQVQRTASASVGSPGGSAPGLMVGANSPSPTVLPTIVGKRISDADRRAAVAREGGSRQLMYTAANGDQGDQGQLGPVQNVAPGVQMQVLDVRSHDRRDARDANRIRQDGGSPNQQGTAQARSPQLSPNPRLSPNPKLAPAPGVNHQATRSAAPRNEERQQQTRESLRVPPPAPPRAVPAPVRAETGRDH